MSQILENLYLSSIVYAKDLKFLKNHSITHILIAAKSLEQFFPKLITYLQLPVTDSISTLIMPYFSKSIEFIRSNKKDSKGSVLVHCLGGRSRSVTIMISYIMFEMRLGFDEAYEFVRKKHPLSTPNPGFIKQLKIFEFCLEKYYIKSTINDMKKLKLDDDDEDHINLNSEEVKRSDDIEVGHIGEYDRLDKIVKKSIQKNFEKK